MALTLYPLADLVTFARDTEKRVFGPDGELVSYAAAVPAFEYDALTGDEIGLSIEDAVTQYIFPSDNPVGVWTGAGGSAVSNVAFSGTLADGPLGPNTMQLLVPNTSNTTHFVLKNATTAPNADLTFELYVKDGGYHRGFVRVHSLAITGDNFQANFDLNDKTISGTAGTGGAGVLNEATIQELQGGVFKITISGRATPNTTQTGFQTTLQVWNASGSTYAGDGTSGLFVSAPQLKLASGASSYVRAVSATTTRAVDKVSFVSLSPWWRAEAATIFMRLRIAKKAPPDKSQTLIHLDDGTGNNVIEIRNPAGTTQIEALIKSGAAIVFQAVGGTFVPRVPFQVALAVSQDAFGISVDGATAVTDTAGNQPIGISRGFIGSSDDLGSNSLNGAVEDFYDYPVALDADDLARKSGET